ncbi:adenine phosphoribosyltransferase [Candidatus Nitrosocosmicus franklandus]|uniref:Adenine phosphoribosyltransferase n=1 Tax=Candidatus Nitrosocosmicus franklandianus TaxID=1798806 RepID=A0A484I7A7_9ARCH|nr:adenine phosphoribosyltransferase [Candidatus Nitrosocosmicus franklandus]VFJ13051.1 Adenine phosphoribosyltransferase [Candidatus Nitrosocosmicus franklandus]
MQSNTDYIQNLIRDYPDFPKQGILFRDITPVFRDVKSLSLLGDFFYEKFSSIDIDYVAGIEARGFILATILGLRFNKGVIMIRKAGKLPGKTIRQDYSIEYGTAMMEIQSDSITKGDNVLVADDLLATGGTASAAANLIEELGGSVSGFAIIVELSSLGGSKLLQSKGYPVHPMVTYK